MSGSAVCVTCNQRFWGHSRNRAEAEVPTAGTHLRFFPSFPLRFHISAHWLLLLVLPTHSGPQFTSKSPPMLLDRSWPCVPLPRLLPDIPGMLQATIPSIYQIHLGLWPRQGAFSPRSALFKEESSSAPILHAEGRHPSQPVQACT